MEQNTLQKSQKSKIWIIANIWLYIIISVIIIGIIWRIISWLLSGFLNDNILSILNWLVIAGSLIYGVWVGVKIVLAKTSISKNDIFKIGIGMTVVLIIIQIIIAIIYSSFNLELIGGLIFIDIILFLSAYFWLRRFVSFHHFV